MYMLTKMVNQLISIHAYVNNIVNQLDLIHVYVDKMVNLAIIFILTISFSIQLSKVTPLLPEVNNFEQCQIAKYQ